MEFPESEYRVPFFVENDFVRKKCKVCGEYYWTQDPERENCGDAPCQEYTFIKKPPTRKSFTLREMRRAFLTFFEKYGHTIINPYPVIARWREDIYVTIASIADFQPFVTDGIIPPPANPLVISQPCLRFTDIDNVGLTAGRHLTIFEMGGAHAFNYPEKQIYWKDQTVRYHHEFVTKDLGVKSELITYKEGVWSGGGNAGPDVEGGVLGLEVSTLVFMQYKVVNGQFVEMPLKIVDTGYGIERYTWLSQGASSGFHAVYGPVLEKIMKMVGLTKIDEKFLIESTKLSAMMKVETVTDRMTLRSKVAERLNMHPSELDKTMIPIESAYAIADHTKALTFMLAEGTVPSNVKAGYLSRLLIRRAYRLLRLLGIEDKLSDIVELQVDYWSPDYPNLKIMRDEILEAMSVEEKTYKNTLKRGTTLANRIAKDLKEEGKKEIPVETLIELYDSHGIPPEIVKEAADPEGVKVLVPDNFYIMVAERHVSAPPTEEVPIIRELKDKVTGLPATEQLYYKDPYQKTFEARVLQVTDEMYVALDRTAFYPEGGGQPPDYGQIRSKTGQAEVVDVQRVGTVILHKIRGWTPSTGERVVGEIDWGRRISLMRYHTATHIITGAARKVLGEHAWQAGAQKDVDKSRLDISHWERLSPKQLNDIEKLANSIIMENIPVEISWIPREKAEKSYGYRLYQGGVVPGREIRVVKIGEWDVEACGGTHCRSTGEIGLIKTIHTERIQDGVERIVFSTGLPALEFVQEREENLRKTAELLNVPIERVEKAAEGVTTEWKKARREIERLKTELAKYEAERRLAEAKTLEDIKLVAYEVKEEDVDLLIKIAETLTDIEPKAVVVICGTNETVKIVTMAGENALKKGIHAGNIAAEVAKVLGGGGSGKPHFGQGGGVKPERVPEAIATVKGIVKRQISGG